MNQRLWVSCIGRFSLNKKHRQCRVTQQHCQKVPMSSRDEVSVKDRVYLSMGFIKRDDGGDVVFAIHSIHDITEQKRVMHLLQSAAEQETALFELSPDAIMMLDEHGFTDCNPATLSIFGCASKEQFVGYHPSHFLPRNSRTVRILLTWQIQRLNKR